MRNDTQSELKEFFSEMLKEFRAVGSTLSALAERMGRMESNVDHLTERQEDTESYEKRITILEEAQKAMEKRVKDNRWLVGIVVTVLAVVVPFVLHMMDHLHWR